MSLAGDGDAERPGVAPGDLHERISQSIDRDELPAAIDPVQVAEFVKHNRVARFAQVNRGRERVVGAKLPPQPRHPAAVRGEPIGLPVHRRIVESPVAGHDGYALRWHAWAIVLMYAVISSIDASS